MTDSARPTSVLRTQLAHAPARSFDQSISPILIRWAAPVLRVPLIAKLIGANVLVVTAGAIIALATGWRPASAAELLAWGAVIACALFVSVGLVVFALRPIDVLETVARRVWAGDLGARVPESYLADRNLTRIGKTFNLLLDGLTSDRAQMRELASAVIRAGDAERARTARELHDSVAQSLAAISWQLGALARDAAGTECQARVPPVKGLAEDVLEEVRLLAQALHPRVLDDLGLAAALRQLAREAHEASGVEVVADSDPETARKLDTDTVAALYRVAQEAVGNAVRHANAATVTVRLVGSEDATVLEIDDDGCGFDVADAERRRPGMGLFTMRERVSLVGGHLDIASQSDGGTRVRAHIPSQSNPVGRAP